MRPSPGCGTAGTGQVLLAGRVSVVLDDVGMLVAHRGGRAGTHHPRSTPRSVACTVEDTGHATLRLQPRGLPGTVVELPAATAGFLRHARELVARACRRHGVDLRL